MITISRTESVYPGSLDTFVHATTDFNPGDAVPSSDFEKLLDAVKKIETELGTDPAGASTDLVTRLAAVTAAEFGEVANIGATTISAAQWGYLGACGAGGGQLLAALTTGESDQLELIGATTISAAQWGYVGAMNQGVATTDEVSFSTVNFAFKSVEHSLVAGTTTFLIGEFQGNIADNVSGIIIISVYQPTSDTDFNCASYIGAFNKPRGGGTVLTEITLTKGGGIAVLTVALNANDIVVTSDDDVALDCKLTFLGGGGTV